MTPRAALAVVTAMCALPVSAWAVQEQDFGGSPIAIGAGARALGMGGAFSAVADDASAATWNPAGMTQLEQREMSVTGGFYANRASGSDGSFNTRDASALDHASFIQPFFAFGCQQTIAVAWQREYDFTRRFNETEGSSSQSFPFSSVNATTSQVTQAGSFASDSVSYAIDIVPTLSLGLTGKAWADRLTGNGAYHQDLVTTSSTALTSSLPFFPASQLTDVITGRKTVRVTNGYSAVIGAWWQATSDLNLALVYKPRYTMRLSSYGTYIDQFTSAQVGNPTTTSTTPTSVSDVSHLTFPTSITAGLAWRHLDAQTVALDVTWTHWREYHVNESGFVASPISPYLSPADAHDGLAVRLGFEQLLIMERWTGVVRCGLLYEGLPGATRVDVPADAAMARTTTDNYVGATAGVSVCLRTILWDLGAQVRYGRHVGAGQFSAPDQNVDLTTVVVRSGIAYQF